MGVDHGLGGKDSKKSRDKRSRRAEKHRKIARNGITTIGTGAKKKTAVVFNEESRVEFLTGFRQRKQQRRKFGLTMQVMHIYWKYLFR